MAAVKVRQEGFTELSEGGPAPIADLVFVHGLQGHPEETWMYGKKEKEAKPTKPKSRLSKVFTRKRHAEDRFDEPACSVAGTPPVFWPLELLAKDFSNARVLTYGYDSRISNFFKGPANQSGIVAHGIALMRALEVERRSCRRRPIIFLVHSLGGLILKQALGRSKNALSNQHGLRDVFESTYATIFFGTPHRGSSYANMGVLARDIAVIAGFDARDTILRSLEPDAEILTILSDEFARMLLEGSFKVHSFQEGMGFTGAHILSRKIVDNDSSRLGDARETTDFINANHMMMCRFRDLDDPGYRKVKGVVSQYLGEIQTAQAREDEQKQRLLAEKIRTSLRAAQINERVAEVENAHEHTFDWVFSPYKSGFLEWLHGDGGLFWIKGKPGSGKSTLMKYLHRDARTKNALSQNGRKVLAMPAFFFHSRGTETEKSFDGVFRSLFYQLLLDVPEVVDSVAGIYREFKEQDLKCPWFLHQLRTAMENLRRQDIEGCICVFIDALDEYSGPPEEIADFVKYLASPVDKGGDGKLKLRVCASSRPETTFVSKLKDIPNLSIHLWTETDIKRYASDRLDGCDRPETGMILDDITSRADGVFLWVKLILDDIWQPLCDGIPIEEARIKLSELPTGLPSFYERMLKQIHADDKPVFMAMLELVLCSDYAVGSELVFDQYFGLAIEIAQRKGLVTPQDISLAPAENKRRWRDVERRIKACSGGLLEISWQDRPQFIHQTAKSFVQDAQDLAIFDGKSTRDMALGGVQRMMRLSTLVVEKMDSAEDWSYDLGEFSVPSCPHQYPHFYPGVIADFLRWALVAESVFESPNTALMYDFHKTITTSCGESWLDT
ncbi:hypothetical protein F5144DRAFT_599720 [Chaetomium tenue]|uniref:Uncharacterized protein n=1 Tax=Chaetomium tenue TaxID=1854479 RepID=A0ACB7PGI8_9PEZI|nr:hypothetical protein F5144DRAFT_599720 [Chaetomium globosum]